MNILIADTLSPKVIKSLEDMGHSVELRSELTAEDLPGALGNAEILVVRSTKVSEAAIAAAPFLSLIIRAGAGVNTIDIDAASRLGIHVANCPGKNADAVAELTIGLMIGADRNIAQATADLRAGVWNKKRYQKAAGLKGRKLGLLGFGAIAQRVARIAQAMGMEVGAWSRSLTQETAAKFGVGYYSTPQELAQHSQVFSIHLASTAETKRIVDENLLALLPEGAVLVNTSRGDIIDQQALTKAITDKGLNVALDVYEGEPSSSSGDFPHRELAGLITGTHHIGASTDQASAAIAEEVLNIVTIYAQNGEVIHAVNNANQSPAPFSLTVRHFNRVGVLAAVLDELQKANINVEEMQNRLFSGGEAALCQLRLDEQPNEELLDRLRVSNNIISVDLKSIEPSAGQLSGEGRP